jgi:hypothetical protein
MILRWTVLAILCSYAAYHSFGWAADAITVSPGTTTLVPSVTWSASALPKSPSQVNDQYSNAIDVAAWFAKVFGERKRQADIVDMLQRSVSEVAPVVQWTGQGALLAIRLIEKSHPDTPFIAAGILGDRAYLVGTGENPEEALYVGWRQGMILPGVPPGWDLNPLGDSYFWVTAQDGKVLARAVPYGLARDLDTRLKDNFGKVALDHSRRSWQSLSRWEAVAVNAKKHLAQNAAKREIDSVMADIRASQARVNAANTELARALERERRAATAAQTIRVLQGLVSVAQLVQEVQTIMNDTVPQLNGATTATAVIEVTDTVYKDSTAKTASMAALFSGSLDDLQKFLDMLKVSANAAGAPSAVGDSLKITKPP